MSTIRPTHMRKRRASPGRPRAITWTSLPFRATDWRGNNNIAESIFGQLREEPQPILGNGRLRRRYRRDVGDNRQVHLRYERLPTRLCVADPEASIFHRHYADRTITDLPGGTPPSCIEGIGRQRWSRALFPKSSTG